MLKKNLKKQKGVVLAIALIALVAMMAAAVALSNTAETGAQLSTNRYLAQSAQSSADVGYAMAKDKLLGVILKDVGGLKEVDTTNGSKLLNAFKDPQIDTPSNCLYSHALVGTNNVNTNGIPRVLEGTDASGKLTNNGLPDPHIVGNCKIENTALNETIYYIMDVQCPRNDQERGFTQSCSYPNNFSSKNANTYDTGLVMYNKASNKFEVKTDNELPTGGDIRGVGWQGYGNDKAPSFAVPLIRISVRVDGPRGTRVYRQQMVSLFQNPAKTK